MHEPSNLRKTFSMYKIIRLFGSIIISFYNYDNNFVVQILFFFKFHMCIHNSDSNNPKHKSKFFVADAILRARTVQVVC